MTDSLAAEQALFAPSHLPEDEGVSDLSRMVAGCADLAELRAVLGHATRQMGFDYFTLNWHIERRHRRENLRPCAPFMLDNCPPAWNRMMMARRYFSDDPVLAVVEKSAAAFAWRDIETLIDLTARQRDIMNATMAAGLGDGFTIPVHVPGDCTGSCSFITRPGRTLPYDSLVEARHIGAVAFDMARRFAAPAKLDPPRLTQRQFDCIVLVAQGKSDWDAGQLLGISDQTVHKHIEDAKRRYGVATRIQLVVRVLFDNRLTFGDILASRPSDRPVVRKLYAV